MPACDLNQVKVKAAAALASPAILVEWNIGNSVEVVSNRLDMTFDGAMQFILEELGQVDPACFVEEKRDYETMADVYRHDARGCEWYVKFGIRADGRLMIMSFHPPIRSMRPAGARVRLR